MLRFPIAAARWSLTVLSALTLGGCTDDVTAPPVPVAGTFTVNATTNWTYVSLADSATVAPTPSANESPDWDIAFFATNVTLNGGAAGPGGITAACICQNSAATNAEHLAMTPESEKADFDAVTEVPAGLVFTSDVLTPAIRDWYAGVGAAATAEPGKTFLVRLSDGVSYAKVHVTALQTPTATSAGRVTIEYAVQATATSAFDATKTIVVDLTTAGAKSVDLNAGTVTTSTTDWDLRLDGFTIKVNGGVSGPGSGAAAVATQTFAATTTANVAVQSYKTDVYTGVFGTKPFYRYNLNGDNRITPTFDVYLIKRGSTVYAVQILNYYNSTNQARHITFRYKQLGS